MNTNILIAIIVIVLIAVGGFFFFSAKDAEAPENGAENAGEPSGNVTQEVPAPGSEGVEEMVVNETATVTYTNSGYSPANVTISLGERVTFINESSRSMWPASAIHPTHTAYPGSGIKKCGTSEANSIFDACSSVSQGNSYSFAFTEAGKWIYHNHLNPRDIGSITVQ